MRLIIIGLLLFTGNGFSQNLAWAKSWGGDSFDHSYSVTTDNSGYIYTTGFFRKTADFGFGEHSYSLTASETSGFLTKTAPNGDLIWVKQIGESGLNNSGLVVVVDSHGDIYLSGSFQGTVDFDSGSGTAELTSTGSGTNIIGNGYLLKLSSGGQFIRVRQLPRPCGSLALDQNDNVYLSGIFQGIADFDPGSSTFNIDGGIWSAFITKLDNSGNFVWAKKLSPESDTLTLGNYNMIQVSSIAADENQNIYLTGGFDVAIDFDPGAGTAVLTPPDENNDIFILKLDENGDYVWVKHLEQANQQIISEPPYAKGNVIAMDQNGGMIVAGVFAGSIDFDPGAGTNILSSLTFPSNNHYYFMSSFIAGYDLDGNLGWVKQLDGISAITISDIALNATDEIYVTGYFSGTGDFDPGQDTFNLVAFNQMNNGDDLFIAKYTNNGNLLWAKGIGGRMHDRGYSIALDNNDNVYVTGIFEDTVDFDPDSSHVWNLTTNFIQSEQHDGFLLKLTECSPYRDTIHQKSCTDFTWSLSGKTYSVSGLHRMIFTDGTGCDSLITLDLTIPVFDNTIAFANDTLFATSTQAAAAYNWYECGNFDVSLSSAPLFVPAEDGYYALVSTYENCEYTSACIEVSILSTQEHLSEEGYLFFPNPVSDDLTVRIMDTEKIVAVEITDVNGKIVMSLNNIKSGTTIPFSERDNGVYLIKITAENTAKVQTYRIIKM